MSSILLATLCVASDKLKRNILNTFLIPQLTATVEPSEAEFRIINLPLLLYMKSVTWKNECRRQGWLTFRYEAESLSFWTFHCAIMDGISVCTRNHFYLFFVGDCQWEIHSRISNISTFDLSSFVLSPTAQCFFSCLSHLIVSFAISDNYKKYTKEATKIPF